MSKSESALGMVAATDRVAEEESEDRSAQGWECADERILRLCQWMANGAWSYGRGLWIRL